jgi:ATP-dependent Lon protease
MEAFTTEEEVYLLDILSMHLQGMDQAKEMMIEDKQTLNDLETFIEQMALHEEQVALAESIKKKVADDIVSRNRYLPSSSSVRALRERLSRYVGRVQERRRRRASVRV